METIKLYNGKVTILFDRGTKEKPRHRFMHPDGTKITSVTTFSGILDKSALIPWAVKMMGLHLYQNWEIGKVNTEGAKAELIETAKKEFRRIKEEAADIGKEIHEWAHEWIKGKNPEMPKNEMVRNGVIAFLDWIKNSGIKITKTESVVYSKKYDYAGWEDWEGTRKGSLIIGDFKSSKGIYDEMRFQLALYWNAREEETGKKYDEGQIVQVGKITGEFNVLTIPRLDYLKDLKAALSLIPIKRRLSELKSKK